MNAQRALRTEAPAATLLVRLAVGVVFASEGLQKFLYPDALGVGRFTKIGIPFPEVMGPFVGGVELVGGCLILLGLLTRFAAFALAIDMLVALASTKLPILIGSGYWIFSAPSTSKLGIWSMLHEARTDLSMLSSSLFLLVVGGGLGSVDWRLCRRWDTEPRTGE